MVPVVPAAGAAEATKAPTVIPGKVFAVGAAKELAVAASATAAAAGDMTVALVGSAAFSTSAPTVPSRRGSILEGPPYYPAAKANG